MNTISVKFLAPNTRIFENRDAVEGLTLAELLTDVGYEGATNYTVLVNNETVTNLNRPLRNGDVISLTSSEKVKGGR